MEKSPVAGRLLHFNRGGGLRGSVQKTIGPSGFNSPTLRRQAGKFI
jgi:hypothetical protein